MKTTRLAILLFGSLFFTSCGNNTDETTENTTDKQKSEADTVKPPVHEGSGMRIAYINNDSLAKKYKRLEVINKEIEQRQLDAEKRLENLEREFAAWYKKVEEAFPTMARSEQEKVEGEARRRQQNMENERMRLSNELSAYQTGVLEKHLETVTRHCTDYAEANGYDYVFVYSQGGPMIYGHKAHDITNEIVAKLNSEYKDLIGE
jgi:Skp family chaperone for outer membrane proteins